jgi:Tfp pilus assembly protein PilF
MFGFRRAPHGRGSWPVRFARALGRAWFALVAELDWLLTLPVLAARHLIRQLSGFPWLCLLQGLPALLVGASVLVLLTVRLVRAAEPATAFYRSQISEAAGRGDFRTARLCLERLEQMGDFPAGLVQAVAECAEAEGQTAYAHLLYDRLAPLDQQGRPAVHVRQARMLLAKGNDPTALAQAETHLRHALEADVALPEARFLLANVCARTGRSREAITWLAPLAVEKPEVDLILSRLHLALGEEAQSRRIAQRALEAFRRKAEGAVNSQEWVLRAAEAAALAELFPVALEMLGPSLAREGADKERRVAAGVFTAWVAKAEKEKAEPAQLLALIQQGLTYDPTNPALLQRLVVLTHRTGKEGETARAELRRIVADGRGAAAAQFLLGTDAWLRGKHEEGRLLMERALALNPSFAPVANNLAWILAHEKDPDLPRALALAEAALDQMRGQANLRDTRGYILLKMGRAKEALADLQAAQQALGNTRERHEALAEAYTRLGQAELAAEHRRLAAAKK